MLSSDSLFPRFFVVPLANPSNFSHCKCFSSRIYIYIYVLHILNYAMQSASMDNFVNLIQHHVYLSIVMMENGDGSVPQTVSGILICQWLPVQNWATVTLVSQLFVWIN